MSRHGGLTGMASAYTKPGVPTWLPSMVVILPFKTSRCCLMLCLSALAVMHLAAWYCIISCCMCVLPTHWSPLKSLSAFCACQGSSHISASLSCPHIHSSPLSTAAHLQLQSCVCLQGTCTGNRQNPKLETSMVHHCIWLKGILVILS